MRSLRLMAGDWQSGGLIGCLLAVLLQVQALAAALPADDPVGATVVCSLAGPAPLAAGPDRPHNDRRDCCKMQCQAAWAAHAALPATAATVSWPPRVAPAPAVVAAAGLRPPPGLIPDARGPPRFA